MLHEGFLVPDHVPKHLVYDFDRFESPAQYEVPQFSLARKLREEAPPIFYAPRAQSWVVSKPSIVADMLRRPELFSSDPAFSPWRESMPARPLPTAYDPPEHGEARAIIQPLFTARAAVNMGADIRSLSADVIDAVADKGGCEFVEEVAKKIPVMIFLKMADAPMEDREHLLDMVERFLRTPDEPLRMAAGRELTDYLARLVADRRQALGTDLVSRLIEGRMLGRSLSEDEIIGAAFLTFLAGLDTVAALLSFTMRFFARHPDHYAQLVDDPAMIAKVIEELLRTAGVAMPERGARGDIVYEGVQFRRGDRILLLTTLTGMDPEENPDPESIDFNRKLSRHNIFGTGAHRCIGMNLARVELKVVLEEWIKRIPAFRIKDDVPIGVLGGIVWIPAALPLVWDEARPRN